MVMISSGAMGGPAVTIYCDGSSLGNPGPGGYGAILVCGSVRKELSAGFSLTTNNRMELRGALHALEALTKPCDVVIVSDSKYVCDAIEKNWVTSWQKKGWMTSGGKQAANKDLWEAMLPLLRKHNVRMQWVKGHSGHPENERCDYLARTAAEGRELAKDVGYGGS